MPARNISLTPHFDQLVASQVESGRFGNASEVVREALRLFEQREQDYAARRAWLQQAVQDGIDQLDRGEGITFETHEELSAWINNITEEVLASPEPQA